MNTLTTPMAPLSGDVHAALINIAGKRRYMSQRLVLYAVLASLGHDGALAVASETLVQLQDAHDRLMGNKGNLPGVYCETLEQAYYGDMCGDRHVRDFIHLASETVSAIGANGIDAPQLLSQLVEQGTPILSLLATLTLLYEEQAKRGAIAERRALHATMMEMKEVTRKARMAALETQLMAARAGAIGPEIAQATNKFTAITAELDQLAEQALIRQR